MRVGDRVVTIGGLYGTIDKIKEDSFVISVADSVRLEFQKSAVGQLRDDEND